MMTKKRILISSCVRSLALSFPLVGFVYGFFNCKDCGDGISGVIGRLFIACVEAVLTTVSFGTPWKNEGGTSSTNLRWYVFATFLILTIIFLVRERSKTNQP